MAVSLQHFTETHHREAPGSEHRSPWIGTEHTAIVEMKKAHESACLRWLQTGALLSLAGHRVL